MQTLRATQSFSGALLANNERDRRLVNPSARAWLFGARVTFFAFGPISNFFAHPDVLEGQVLTDKCVFKPRWTLDGGCG